VAIRMDRRAYAPRARVGIAGSESVPTGIAISTRCALEGVHVESVPVPAPRRCRHEHIGAGTEVKSKVSEEEWKLRVDLAACYRSSRTTLGRPGVHAPSPRAWPARSTIS